MQSLVNYYEERYKIYEAKFKNLNDDELMNIDVMLQDILDNDYASLETDSSTWVDKDIKVNYGDKFFVELKNPFADELRFSASPNQTKIADEPETIQCIGIADKFGRIFLQGIWDNAEPAYIEYKKAERKTTKQGKSYTTKAGWYLTRKDIEAYKVKKWYSGKRGEGAFYNVDKNKTTGAWGISISNDIKYLKNISTLKADVQKINDNIKKEAERLEAANKKDAELKKFWAERKNYKNFGLANAWEETPAELQKAIDDKDAKWFIVTVGHCYTEYWCDKYKLYYTVDSSD